jgi:acyl dehydratase
MYSVVARNTATQSENRMHDDTVAATYGFRGGLVPGVDVYAYLCHVPASQWGRAWLDSGRMAARFVAPVYDGEVVTVAGDEEGPDGELQLELRGPDGSVRATALASPHHGAPDGPPPLGRRDPPPPGDRPGPSDTSLAPGTLLASSEAGFRAEHAGDYLDAVGEHLELFRVGGVAHPGWLLRHANYVLAATVRLGPWIHVSSDCVHLGAVLDGDRVSARGSVAGLDERKGHRFVALDVDWVAHTDGNGDERLVMRARHTAIYEPRRG